jgi:hypothetical protein
MDLIAQLQVSLFLIGVLTSYEDFIEMKRVFSLSTISVIVLLAMFSMNIASAKAAGQTVTCQSIADFFYPFRNQARTNFLTWDKLYLLQPGPQLIFTFMPGTTSTVDVRTTDFKGTYGTSEITPLPFSFNYASLRTDEIWGIVATQGNFFVSVSCVDSSAAGLGPCPIFLDGRLNDCDADETAAIYCEADGSVMVMAIWQGKGYDAFSASPDEIALVPKKPTANTAIKSGNGATLYRLMSGQLQVNRAADDTGKLYRFIFDDCAKP